ncbi:uncharacterized protein DUF397 [Haloactinospora alba]|uniref:Uncharacterized protein DUF397 n=1 Tax=Haloactinospora alba TaxID=405555 RepID=A0A543N7N1_9ACTN|nr:DUF397 domain-containing protein [Haloactinospora alba]TQN27820.1 uncharacterized protein DUF397 [Haloactinospora alba]
MTRKHQDWHKSSYSGGSTGNCVEVAEGTVTAVRDTQNRQDGHLSFSASEWKVFLDEVRADNL